MGRRSMYHLSRVTSGQLNETERYDLLRPVIAVNILDFDYIKDSEDYINRYRMKNVKNSAEMPDAEYFEIIFVELSKLPKEIGDGLRELWVRFLAVQSEEELDMIAQKSPVM